MVSARIVGPVEYGDKGEASRWSYYVKGGKQEDRLIVFVGLTVVAVGDGVASVVGKSFGKIAIGNRTLEGFAAFVISAVLFNLFFGNQKAGLLELTLYIFIGLVELFSGLIDNLTLPILALRYISIWRSM